MISVRDNSICTCCINALSLVYSLLTVHLVFQFRSRWVRQGRVSNPYEHSLRALGSFFSRSWCLQGFTQGTVRTVEIKTNIRFVYLRKNKPIKSSIKIKIIISVVSISSRTESIRFCNTELMLEMIANFLSIASRHVFKPSFSSRML